MKTSAWGPAGCACFLACWLAAPAAAAAEDDPPPAPVAAPGLCLERLAKMGPAELECLYRAAAPGPIPHGYLRGRAIYCPCERLAGIRSGLTRALWRGKLFDDCGGSLVNQWCGFKAIRAAVGYGPSWLDGGPSVIMDYGDTSRVWADVRDEVREVAPGLYLGLMYRRKPCGPQFKMFFALEACPH